MGEKITKEELMNLPMFRLIDGNKVFDFDGYHNLYEWCRTDGKAYGLIGTALGCAELVLLFGERPLRYLVQEKRIERLTPELEWVDIHGKDENGKEE